MPSWTSIRTETSAAGSTHDVIRRQYIKRLADYTGRNVIVYYSGWLEKATLQAQGLQGFEVNDSDKNGFMATIHEMDRDKGLDLLLHTPGGNVAATESLVDYLKAMFQNVRVIVPQLAMSAGTMIALSASSIVMGKHSSLGPIDPQIGGVAAHGIVEEFQRAHREVREDPGTIPIWQPIIAKYSPTLIGECEKAISWANEMVKRWLMEGMFSGEDDPGQAADRVISELASHALTLSHDRHISLANAQRLGLNVEELEGDPELQDCVLSVHHSCIQTLAETPAFKIIENQNGIASIMAVNLRPA
ncbi:SDH family Clp fold serine proteinase [Sinomonas halotolerans]|uniref:ATP-dependent Clp protease proteolytic subunit n=1 Tax=Sinomonas halotolerans TaxID=1644133 RepID=A0ABU9WZU0_9MICC